MKKLFKLMALLCVITAGFVIGNAQTTTPSRVAYNYGPDNGPKIVKVSKAFKKRAGKVRKTNYSRKPSVKKRPIAPRPKPVEVVETAEAKIVIEGDKFDLACNPGGKFVLDLSVMKTDKTQLDAKLAQDYSKSIFATAVLDNTTKEITIQCGFPSVQQFVVQSADFPKLNKKITVTVNKVPVESLAADTDTLDFANPDTDANTSSGQFQLVAADTAGNNLGIARIKATSDNPNVLLAFSDLNDLMSLKVTAKFGGENVEAIVTVEAVDATKNFLPLKLKVTIAALVSPPINAPTPTPCGNAMVALNDPCYKESPSTGNTPAKPAATATYTATATSTSTPVATASPIATQKSATATPTTESNSVRDVG